MRIIITGSPGVGKTSVAKTLGKKLGCQVLNEKQFALEKKIVKWNAEEDELVIPLIPYAKALDKLFTENKNVIIEGHLLCELRAKPDFVVLIRLQPELLEGRLHLRNYSEEKVQDNVFSEGIDYCKKKVLRNYPEKKIIEVQSGKSIKETLDRIIMELKEKGAKL